MVMAAIAAAGIGAAALGNWAAARKKRKNAIQDRAQQLDFTRSLNWNPVYAKDLMNTPYQKTKSPLARSYLDSILTGNNPDMTFSGEPNAAQTKAEQAVRKEQMYGSNQDLLAQSEQERSTNPYTVSTPTAPAGGAAGGGIGATPEELAAIQKREEDKKKVLSSGVFKGVNW